jgi:hypothetical protein
MSCAVVVPTEWDKGLDKLEQYLDGMNNKVSG